MEYSIFKLPTYLSFGLICHLWQQYSHKEEFQDLKMQMRANIAVDHFRRSSQVRVEMTWKIINIRIESTWFWISCTIRRTSRSLLHLIYFAACFTFCCWQWYSFCRCRKFCLNKASNGNTSTNRASTISRYSATIWVSRISSDHLIIKTQVVQ